MSEPKRWSPVLRTDTARGKGYQFAEMELSDIGMWVSISEYGILQSENARLKAEVERLRSQFANSEWQPIETAPKDTTDVLCFCVEPEFEGEENPHTEIRVCFFGQMQEGYWCWMSHYGYEQRPTHWMPLPKPPAK